MEITPEEFVQLASIINKTIGKEREEYYKEGFEDGKKAQMPENLMDALIDYGKKSETLVDFHKSTSETDGTFWVQLKPTRDGSEGIKAVDIAFEENMNEIHHIGIDKDE